MSSVSVGSYISSPSSGWQAISDTASTFIGGPKAIVDNIASQVGAKWIEALGSYFIDCTGDHPDIEFGINGNTYSISANKLQNLGRHRTLHVRFLPINRWWILSILDAWTTSDQRILPNP
ncbi:hypothetical protein COOONC_24945 [Cooperia oncophora]